MIEYLDLDDLLEIARHAIGEDVTVRDYGLLESALARPRASVFGQDAYPDLHLKGAALLHSLAPRMKGHAATTRQSPASTRLQSGYAPGATTKAESSIAEIATPADDACVRCSCSYLNELPKPPPPTPGTRLR